MAPDPQMDGNDRDGESPIGPAQRLLQAVEVLATQGALSHEALQSHLELSKSATWRLVQNLRAADWVRVRLGGRVVELSARVIPLMAGAKGANAELAALSDRLANVATRFPVHLDLLVLDALGRLSVHDSTRRRVDLASLLAALDDSSELAILSAMSSGERAALLADTGEDGLAHLRLRHDAGKAALGPIHDEASEMPGYAWEQSTGCLIAAVRCISGQAIALRIAPRSTTTRQSSLVECFIALRRGLQGHVEAFGKGRNTPNL